MFAIYAVTFPMCLIGWVAGEIGVAAFLVQIAFLSVIVSTRFCIPVLKRLAMRFDFWFLLGHVAISGVGGFALFADALKGLQWLQFGVLSVLSIGWDSIPRRTRATTCMYVLGTLMTGALLMGLFFRRFPVLVVQIPVFNDAISVNDRVFSSALCFWIFLARFCVTSLVFPSHLVIMNGLRSVKVRTSAARDILHAYSLEGRGVAAPYAARGRGAAVAPSPASPSPQHARRALGEVAGAALGACGGDDARARKLLLDLLDAAAQQQPLTNTFKRQHTLSTSWARGNGEEGFERLILPRFMPVVVDSTRTIAAAIGGARFSNACYSVCRSRPFIAITFALMPLGYTLFVLTLSVKAAAHLAPACIAVLTVPAVMNVLQVLLLNTEVLRGVILRRFDTYWSLANIYAAAGTGFYIFDSPNNAALWLASQVQMSTYFLQDAGPPSVRARRTNSVALAFYSLFQVFSVLAIWLRIYDVHDAFVTILGQPVNLRHWCFAAQVNVTVIATRFAIRALSDQRNLMYISGLIRVRLPAAEARELRAVMLAEQTVRTNYIPSNFKSQARRDAGFNRDRDRDHSPSHSPARTPTSSSRKAPR